MSTGFSTPPTNMTVSDSENAISIPAALSLEYESVAIGYDAVASGEYSVAIGDSSNASNSYSVAIGYQVTNSISNLVTCNPYTLGGGHLYTQSAIPNSVESITSGSTIGPFTDTNGVNSDYDLYVPITLSPTSSEAASATVSITIDGTSYTLGTWNSPAGGPSLGILAHVRVPGNNSATITLTNATAGTATVIQ